MIFGIFGMECLKKNGLHAKENLRKRGYDLEVICEEESLKICLVKGKGIPGQWETVTQRAGKSVMVREGEIYPLRDPGNEACSIIQENMREEKTPEELGKWNGAFSVAAWKASRKAGLIARDPLGICQMFYALREDGILFCSGLRLLALALGLEGEIDPPVLMKYLVFCYNPGLDTLYKGIKRLRPGHYLVWQDGKTEFKPYWQLNFEQDRSVSVETAADSIREKLASAVKTRVNRSARTGAFLSGGLDSSSVVSLLRRENVEPLHTFSFRCRGESFDESGYARRMADEVGAFHTVVEYGSANVLEAREMVRLMEEPFCDVGINVATFLLAKAAGGEVDEIYTGDGGDELFAGHPVYVADRAARLFRVLPKWPRNWMFALGRSLPDSDQKKDLRVKIKRFSQSYAYPDALGTHRWRVYYHPGTLKNLMKDTGGEEAALKVFDDVIGYNKEAKDLDSLSRSLYTDYQTVVQFYLRRLDIAGAMGLRPKLPMLDKDLVSYCASLPARLKIRGFSDVKYIERIAVEPLLPHEIVHRKDKLGHSIPLKNWMRDAGEVRTFMLELLSEERIRHRGWFNKNFIDSMMEEHFTRKANHSHRLWALMILELWMEHHVDRNR